ncbi:sugar transferase [Bacillus paranthracis]|uniref:sugar transferase n=1 Tax=Bacillus paranthracis TaxID=2026186 RepID=UPI000200F9CA|nr:sugar transferase [Bacillus paranthracis]ADY24478.1 sugar transferase [Bacillus thuringiensis serovar finitimus YBT-020]MRC72579.1 sugar transferase [Bacillus thuringiensis]OTX72985.1 glycosyl transferase [Bacillus thuringiensis serovar finitimus]MCR6800770.1 sugar transferase [Bacillus paranthracis]MEC3357087.1 sugar transferase [Bacillus paranthracis]
MKNKLVLKKWEELPNDMKTDSVKKYYELLYKKRFSLFFKRIFDIVMGVFVLLILSPMFILISIAIKVDSKGPIIFRQVRVTQYGKQFEIFKFRTMVNDADKVGTQVTTRNDNRITRVGKLLRKIRLDEIPQLFNVILGDMSFVGTRPEVVKYVEKYTDEMMATLLLPAGITSEASIQYKNEEQLLTNTENVDETYINEVLPEKMRYNLRSIESFCFLGDIRTMINTVFAVIKRNNESEKAVEDKMTNKNEAKM